MGVREDMKRPRVLLMGRRCDEQQRLRGRQRGLYLERRTLIGARPGTSSLLRCRDDLGKPSGIKHGEFSEDLSIKRNVGLV